MSVSILIVISTFALDFIHSDRSIFKIVDLDEAWAFLNVAQGETLSNKLVRAGRAMNAGVYFVTQSSGDVSKESLKNNIGLKFAFRSTDTNEIKQTLEFFGLDSEDENNQKEAIEARTTEISKYLTKELQDLNADTIRTDIPTSATVTNVLVWNVEQSGTDDFTVAYEVDQQVKEGEQTQVVTENYTVTVHVDKDGAMVITQNPTLAPSVQKSKYEPKVQEADVSVSSDTVKDATAFLETFFKLYPTATEKELAYYVKDGVIAPVSGDYVFSELVNPVFTKDGDNLKVSVSVKYLDNKSKMTQISQYELVLHKDDNWKIVE